MLFIPVANDFMLVHGLSFLYPAPLWLCRLKRLSGMQRGYHEIPLNNESTLKTRQFFCETKTETGIGMLKFTQSCGTDLLSSPITLSQD
jgi:hypothetical protein